MSVDALVSPVPPGCTPRFTQDTPAPDALAVGMRVCSRHRGPYVVARVVPLATPAPDGATTAPVFLALRHIDSGREGTPWVNAGGYAHVNVAYRDADGRWWGDGAPLYVAPADAAADACLRAVLRMPLGDGAKTAAAPAPAPAPPVNDLSGLGLFAGALS